MPSFASARRIVETKTAVAGGLPNDSASRLDGCDGVSWQLNTDHQARACRQFRMQKDRDGEIVLRDRTADLPDARRDASGVG
jgi:hypothetical protein